MKLKIIIIISIFSLLAKSQVHSQKIKIDYHLGYNCSKEINGQKIRGGCVTNEKMKYSLSESGKYFKSDKLIIERDTRQYKNGKFGENLEKDSLTVFKIRRRVSSEKLDKLMKIIKLIDNGKDEKVDSIDYLKKEIISKWNKRTFELNKWKIHKIKKIALKENVDLSTDGLIQKITEYIKEANSGSLVSSVVEYLTITFKLEEKEYSISQENLGETNVSWQIKIDNKRYFVISPELNKIVDKFIPKKMQAKKKLNEFMNLKELKKALKKE